MLTENASSERKNCDDMHRQPSRNNANLDTVVCIVNTNDLELENAAVDQEHKQSRGSTSSRRDQPSKRPNESSAHRSARHSPPSVTRKRQPSPSTNPGSSSGRSHHHHHYATQRPPRAASRSLSPSPPPSRSYRSSRPVTAVKRPHSPSRSPYERRPPTHRPRPQASKESTSDKASASMSTSEDQARSKKPEKRTSHHDTGDLSFISEDECTKPTDARPSRSAAPHESPSTATNSKLHSTPSLPSQPPSAHDNPLEISNVAPNYELSLLAENALFTADNSTVQAPAATPAHDLKHTIDLMNAFAAMPSSRGMAEQIETYKKEILAIIRDQIEFHKQEIEYRKLDLNLRHRELAEREKTITLRSTEAKAAATAASGPSPSAARTEPAVVDAKPQQQIEVNVHPDTEHVKPDEPVVQAVLSTVDAVKPTVTIRNGTDSSSSTRKPALKSRFSADEPEDDPSLFNTTNSVKKATVSKVSAPLSSESTLSMSDTDLKITSSNSSRRVEYQSVKGDESAPTTITVPRNDLRYTLIRNHVKQTGADGNGDDEANDRRVSSDDEQTMAINKKVPSKTQANKEEKQQRTPPALYKSLSVRPFCSHDYHQQQQQQQQRSVTSTLIDPNFDNNKRDNRRQQQQQQRTGHGRQPYSSQHSSSVNNSSDDRSYPTVSTPTYQSNYGSSQKQYENDGRDSRTYDHKHTKPSRAPNRYN